MREGEICTIDKQIQRRKRQVYLFSDAILIVKQKKQRSQFKKYSFMHLFLLKNLKVIDHGDTESKFII